jgi:AcrR family transcriptional regulator
MKNTRRHILFESFKMFLERGFKEVSMRELVEKSKLSKGAFYHYFSSKEELFKEAITTFFFTGLAEKFFAPSFMVSVSGNLKNLNDFKANSFSELLQATSQKELGSGYFTLIFQAIKMFPDFRETLLVANKKEEEVLAQIFISGIENGEIRGGLSPQALAIMFSSMLDGMELHAVVSGDLENLHEKEKELVDDFCRMIA